MIYCSKFSTMGNLGNHLMRLFTIISFAKKYKTDWAIPEWEYAKYFDYDFPIRQIKAPQVKEKAFHYTPEYWDKIDWSKDVDLYGWFQSWKYWDKEEIKRVLKFKCDIFNNTFVGSFVSVSVRRGDFVNNKNYYQLPAEYYLGALEKHFPNSSVYVFSDDIEWCKENFDEEKHSCQFVYIDASPIEQLYIMIHSCGYVLSNSTFSCSGAYLSQNPNAKIVRPKFNFAGPLASRKSEKDFWPPEWIVYDYENVKSAVIVYHKNLYQYPQEWIDRFRESIRNQTYKDFDIIELNYGGGEERIFDDSIFESIKMLSFPHAMNYLFDKCKDYDCVFNTNCDDYYSEDRFEIQIGLIRQGCDIVSSNFSLVDDDNIKLTHRFEEKNIDRELSKNHNVICHPVVAYSKRFINKERYNPEEIPFEDMKLWQRTVRDYGYIITPEVLCFHRLHKNSVGHNLKEV